MSNELDWVDIPGYEGKYQISRVGSVRSLSYLRSPNVRVLQLVTSKDGYHKVSLCKNGIVKSCRVARLMALTFIPNPERKLYVNHIDGNKLNDSLENLEWVTFSENVRHAFKMGLSSPPRPFNSGKKYNFVHIDGRTFYGTCSELARACLINHTHLYDVARGKNRCYSAMGWSVVGRPLPKKYRGAEYTFVHDNGSTFFGTVRELNLKYGCPISSTNKMIAGCDGFKNVRGWSLLDMENKA